MSGGFTIFKRELASYFNSPIAYIFIIVFLTLTTGLYMMDFFLAGQADMRGLFGNLPLFLIFFIPAVSMRLWAEDRRSGTFELLMTLPLRAGDVMMGKYMAALTFYLIALAGTLPIPILLGLLGNPDGGVILSGYLGAFLVGGLYLAVGIFVSGLVRDQITAFILGMIACFFLFLMGHDGVAATMDGWLPGLGSLFQSAFGLLPHYMSMQRGVVLLGDLSYFVTLSAAFLLMNAMWLRVQSSQKNPLAGQGKSGLPGRILRAARFGLFSLLAVAVAVLVSSLLGDLRGSRADLTEEKLFTLSESGQSLLGKLAVPVQVKYYVTRKDKMPTGLGNLERDITDKLRDFAEASGGMLEFSIHDPSDDEELQELLHGKGLRPFQVKSVERDEIGVKLIYSALSIAYKDKPEEILPQVLPGSLTTLEYELVSRVFRLTQDRKPVLAVYAPKPQLDPQTAAMYAQMGMQVPELPDTWESLVGLMGEEHYDVRRIDLTADSGIPEDADALLVLGPENLNERQAWEIGRALHRGVGTLMAVQNHVYSYNPAPRGGFSIVAQQRSSGLESLLGHYGLAVRGEQFFDAESEVLDIPRTQNLGGLRFQTSEAVRAPMQIAVRGGQMNRELAITNRLETLFYLWGTDLAKDPSRLAGLNLGCRTLFSSSERTWRKAFSADPLTQADVSAAGDKLEPEMPLAFLLDGQFPKPDGGRPAWPAMSDSAAAAEAPTAMQAAPGQLLLTGCAKLFEDPFLRAGQNAMLLLNAVDALALDGQLIGIRSKLVTQRSIKSIEAGRKLLARILVVGLLPLLLTIYGILRMLMRRKETAIYQAGLARREA
jgi:ABC-2 type transport system permease protein